MQVGIFNSLFIFVIAALNDYVIVASIIVIRKSINCAALSVRHNDTQEMYVCVCVCVCV